MKRREFLTATGVALSVAGNPLAAAAQSVPSPARPWHKMRLGCQRGPTNAALLEIFKRHGVEHICG
jgi:hypothetical protein